MPRSVFKIFWDHLNEGNPVAAYVKNIAKNGAYYWVMALAYPCEVGYMSVRLKPGSNLFNKAKRIYKKTLQLEKKKEQALGKRKGMYRSEEFLLEALQEEGYDSYDAFMWEALKQEMRNREQVLDQQNFIFFEQAQNVSEHLKLYSRDWGIFLPTWKASVNYMIFYLSILIICSNSRALYCCYPLMPRSAHPSWTALTIP